MTQNQLELMKIEENKRHNLVDESNEKYSNKTKRRQANWAVVSDVISAVERLVPIPTIRLSKTLGNTKLSEDKLNKVTNDLSAKIKANTDMLQNLSDADKEKQTFNWLKETLKSANVRIYPKGGKK